MHERFVRRVARNSAERLFRAWRPASQETVRAVKNEHVDQVLHREIALLNERESGYSSSWALNVTRDASSFFQAPSAQLEESFLNDESSPER